MFFAILDKDNYYTGNYNTSDDTASGVRIDMLPSEVDIRLQKAYKAVKKTKLVNKKVPVMEKYITTTVKQTTTDENTGEEKEIEVPSVRILTDEEIKKEGIDESKVSLREKTDESGNVVYETKEVQEEYYAWEKDEDKYKEIRSKILDELKFQKKQDLGVICTSVINSGVSVKLSDGKTYRFSLTEKDQTGIMALYANAKDPNFTGTLQWHPDNGLCSFYSKEDIITIATSAIYYRTYNETLINHLNRYVESLDDELEIKSVLYSPDYLKGDIATHFTEFLTELQKNNPAFANVSIN